MIIFISAAVSDVPSDSADTSAVLDHVPEDVRSNESTEPNTAADKKSNWWSTAPAAAKLLLRGVRDSADAFGPLKSVVGGLCFILDNCEVESSLAHAITTLTDIAANEGK